MYAQPPCPQDSIGGGGAGVGAVDQQVIEQGPTFCTECPTGGFVSWSMPEDFNGHIQLYSPNGQQQFSLQLVQQCRWLLLDSCITLPTSPTNGPFDLRFAVFGASQLYISGQLGDTLNIICKSTPSPQEELYIPLIDLATCSVPLSIQDDWGACNAYQYIDIMTLKQFATDDENALPSGIYWKWCSTVANGKKIAIFGP